MTIPASDLAATVAAHDKLLKALIGLLAVKDRDLLEDLRAVFAMIDHAHPAATPAEARTWAQVRRDLDVIGEMVAGDDEEQAPPSDRPAH